MKRDYNFFNESKVENPIDTKGVYIHMDTVYFDSIKGYMDYSISIIKFNSDYTVQYTNSFTLSNITPLNDSLILKKIPNRKMDLYKINNDNIGVYSYRANEVKINPPYPKTQTRVVKSHTNYQLLNDSTISNTNWKIKEHRKLYYLYKNFSKKHDSIYCSFCN